VATTQQLQAWIAALDEAMASGVLRASYDGKSAEYRSLDEMRQARADLQAQLDGKPKRKTLRVAASRGYYSGSGI
jgi:hypothetical protein